MTTYPYIKHKVVRRSRNVVCVPMFIYVLFHRLYFTQDSPLKLSLLWGAKMVCCKCRSCNDNVTHIKTFGLLNNTSASYDITITILSTRLCGNQFKDLPHSQHHKISSLLYSDGANKDVKLNKVEKKIKINVNLQK